MLSAPPAAGSSSTSRSPEPTQPARSATAGARRREIRRSSFHLQELPAHPPDTAGRRSRKDRRPAGRRRRQAKRSAPARRRSSSHRRRRPARLALPPAATPRAGAIPAHPRQRPTHGPARCSAQVSSGTLMIASSASGLDVLLAQRRLRRLRRRLRLEPVAHCAGKPVAPPRGRRRRRSDGRARRGCRRWRPPDRRAGRCVLRAATSPACVRRGSGGVQASRPSAQIAPAMVFTFGGTQHRLAVAPQLAVDAAQARIDAPMPRAASAHFLETATRLSAEACIEPVAVSMRAIAAAVWSSRASSSASSMKTSTYFAPPGRPGIRRGRRGVAARFAMAFITSS